MYADNTRVADYIKTLETEAESLEDSLCDLVLYSKGCLQYSELKILSYQERNRLQKALSKKMQAESGVELL